MFFILVLVVCILGVRISSAEEKRDMGGWEEGSAYNQLYDPKEMEKFKAIAMGFKKIVPLPGMSPGVALLASTTGLRVRNCYGGLNAWAVVFQGGMKSSQTCSFLAICSTAMSRGKRTGLLRLWVDRVWLIPGTTFRLFQPTTPIIHLAPMVN